MNMPRLLYASLRDYPESKADELYQYLDGDANAIHEMIEKLCETHQKLLREGGGG